MSITEVANVFVTKVRVNSVTRLGPLSQTSSQLGLNQQSSESE